MPSVFAPVAALLLSVAVLLMGHGLQGTLLPVRAQLEDFGSLNIGILGSSYYLGFALGCLMGPKAVQRVGHIRVFTAMVSIASTVSILHALILAPEVWWVFRGATGLNDHHTHTKSQYCNLADTLGRIGQAGESLWVQSFIRLASPAAIKIRWEHTHA